jgi:nucleoside-diphosphate kinase
MERTLVIVKPDAVARGKIGEILRRFEDAGLRICALKMLHLDKRQAEEFYHIHQARPFFDSLTTFMASGPVAVLILEGEAAIATVRAIMGATDPARASPGTIRRDLGTNVERNAVHGSDSPESAAFEIPYFFGGREAFEYVREGKERTRS